MNCLECRLYGAYKMLINAMVDTIKGTTVKLLTLSFNWV
jgi:hypothetical protein